MNIVCIGAGTVGHAWAVVFARAGHDVALYDAQPGLVANHALPGVRAMLGLLEESGLLTEPVETIAGRIREAGSLADAVANAAYVQESVREDVAIKREVFSAIAAAAPADAILASSTSAIPGSAFLSHIASPERALVAHPVNPPAFIPLVELCGTGLTSEATLAAADRLLSGAGMKPIRVNKEIDGFILNRLQYTLVAEAMHLVGEGYCSASDIDRVLTEGLALRWAFYGPFAVAHLNAVDGFQGFVDRLGPMMRRMGEDAKTAYPWTPAQAAAIHAEISKTLPVAELPDHVRQRDRSILALRALRESRAGKP